jgi:hypothetical protein
MYAKVGIGVFLVFSVFATGVAVFDTANSDEMEAYVEESAEWCDERDGMLYNSQSVVHGGLHCRLPNGTHVHMHEVIDRGASA